MSTKTKYDPQATPALFEELTSSTENYTNKQLAEKLGISVRILYKWEETYPAMQEARGRGEKARYHLLKKEAEKSLLKQLQGYYIEETKTVYIDDGTGAPRIREQITTRKHVAPSPAITIFTLSNLDPERWLQQRVARELPAQDKQIVVEFIDTDSTPEK